MNGASPRKNDADLRAGARRGAAVQAEDLLQHIRLRWLILGVMLAGIVAFTAVGIVDHRAVKGALMGSIIVAINGLTWLLIVRHNRVRLRCNGYRW